ncbi:MAG: hypothetical protein H7Y11_09370 [Armatimonadetes bacterium]|nr:hypothetical protein [Anaerolineae bacterium]
MQAAHYQYPLDLRFRLIALAPRIIVTDSSGQEVAFVHQNLWKLKEDVRIYTDQSKAREIFRIKADRILDIRTKYYFTQSDTERPLGYVQPRALRSIWRANYQVFDTSGAVTHFVREDNPWIKVGDALFSELPVVGIFSGMLLHPSYTIYRGSDTNDLSQPLMRLTKTAGFFEGKFVLDRLGSGDALAPKIKILDTEEEARLLLAMLLMIQFMRRRG